MTVKLGLEPGGVDPFVLSEVSNVIVADKSLLEKRFVVGSAGSKFCGLKVKPGELLETLKDVRILDVSKEPEH